MSRRLIDTRVGEYTNNFSCVLIYSLVIFFLASCLFWVPLFNIDKDYSPIMYLMENEFVKTNIISYLPISYISFYCLLFANLFFCLSVNSIRRSIYFKISKIIGFILGLAIVVFHSYLLFNSLTLNHSNLLGYFYYLSMVATIMILELIVFYNTKKISIYD